MISLIIPCFNEEESLPLFYPEVTSVLQEMNCDYELIFVNDGSRDRTLEILKELSEKDPHVIYLSFSRNFGKEAAMYAGFCNARGDYVAVMDADLQDPPALLPEMLQKLESGEYDSVATRRDHLYERIQPFLQGNLRMDRFQNPLASLQKHRTCCR